MNNLKELRGNISVNEMTWLILGGEKSIGQKPVSGLDYLVAATSGIPKSSVENLANVLNIPMRDMAILLNLSYKTLTRKKKDEVFGNLVSSLSVEIANTVAKGLAVFEDTERLNRWLHKENKALKGQKPFDLLNTPTGIKLVSQILGRIEDGVYS
ncbi:MbcA/ParS/Xre antitoxin family protein [Dyadobacter sp. CY345]|uniref:type II RES/Xre toxin-antitoxin system antitoxin n=1 Tax=Dyadobacter sp. CY345 TaxID=2909335 RepID=UPI001F44F7CE|nr:antitoxin Xre/MbcA/ParS toxin-binding domain-containing protein [Dyadobacter sp. CY345]MCF2447159.1 MbcA/ParS/Xre antitoxin family protein [Dyadobacter sp. CY345]